MRSVDDLTQKHTRPHRPVKTIVSGIADPSGEDVPLSGEGSQNASEHAAHAQNIEVSPEELSRRRDLRSKLVFTIDPWNAKDLDDALSLEKLPNGNYEVRVYACVCV